MCGFVKTLHLLKTTYRWEKNQDRGVRTWEIQWKK